MNPSAMRNGVASMSVHRLDIIVAGLPLDRKRHAGQYAKLAIEICDLVAAIVHRGLGSRHECGRLPRIRGRDATVKASLYNKAPHYSHAHIFRVLISEIVT